MGFQAGHHVVEAVPVDVVNAQLGAAGARAGPRPAPEFHRMIGPRSRRRSLRRLFPPPVRRDDIHATVAVDVAGADAVLRHHPVARLGNGMHDPRRGRVRRIAAGPVDRASAQKHGVGLAVAIDIFEDRDLRIDRRQNVVLVPSAQFAFRVDVERPSACRWRSERPASHRRCSHRRSSRPPACIASPQRRSGWDRSRARPGSRVPDSRRDRR